MFVAILLGVAALLALLAILLIPRSGKPDDGPLPVDLETRLLLGEDPEADGDRADERSEPAARPDATAE